MIPSLLGTQFWKKEFDAFASFILCLQTFIVVALDISANCWQRQSQWPFNSDGPTELNGRWEPRRCKRRREVGGGPADLPKAESAGPEWCPDRCGPGRSLRLVRVGSPLAAGLGVVVHRVHVPPGGSPQHAMAEQPNIPPQKPGRTLIGRIEVGKGNVVGAINWAYFFKVENPPKYTYLHICTPLTLYFRLMLPYKFGTGILPTHYHFERKLRLFSLLDFPLFSAAWGVCH